jgi:transposase
MAMFRRKEPEQQPSIWIATQDLPSTPVNAFYQRLDKALVKFGFGAAVRSLCQPFYESDLSVGGRPGIDPEVYFKMQMVGFFENLASERAIAARCSDSLSIREFLHYALQERTPDHSSLTVIRQRLTAEVYQQVFGLILLALKKNKLLKGKRLAIDASVLEANASLRSLEHRLTGEAYGDYVKKLAEAAGVDPTNPAAVARFDRKRPDRKTSNDEWQNPHETGQALLARRGELLERTFQHVLDCGGARQTTLRGRENILKRYLIQAACANLSLLMRTLTGLGTPKQALAASRARISDVCRIILAFPALVRHGWAQIVRCARNTFDFWILESLATEPKRRFPSNTRSLEPNI